MATLILDSAVKGALILVLAGAAAALLRRASAAARHLAWALAVVGLCLLPGLAVIVPHWRAPVLPLAAPSAADPSPVRDPARLTPFKAEIDPERIALGREECRPARATENARELNPEVTITRNGMSGILLLWSAGVLIVGTRLLFSLVAVARRSDPAASITDGSWGLLLTEITRRYGIHRPVSLRVTSGSTIPSTWGLRRPVVLLPVEALDWPQERLRAVLMHELAHVARGDFLVQTLARLACALHWFNPLAWLADRRLRVECEQASDDLVLEAGMKPTDYATHLVEVLVAAQRGNEPPVGALAMARQNGFEDRVRMILDSKRPRGRPGPRRRALVAMVASTLVLPLALVRLDARAHDAPKLERLPSGMTIEVVAISTHPSGPATWWSPDGTPLAQAPCDPVAETVDLPGGDLKEVVARIAGLPEGSELSWHPTECESQGTSTPRKEGTPVPGLKRAVAHFSKGPATCELHFDIAVGPWSTEQVFDGKRSAGISKGDRSFFLGKARETHHGTALALAHNITDRAIRLVAIDAEGHERHPTSSAQGGAGHLNGLDVEFDLPPAQIRELRLQSRPVGRFEIKNVALRPRKAGP